LRPSQTHPISFFLKAMFPFGFSYSYHVQLFQKDGLIRAEDGDMSDGCDEINVLTKTLFPCSNADVLQNT
jgi:hypothetical protein